MGTQSSTCASWARKVASVALASILAASMSVPVGISGEAYAVQSGKVTAGAIAGSVKARTASKAKATPKLKLTLSSPKRVSLKRGMTYKVVAKATKGAKIQYASSKKSVATVSKKGVVTGKAVGGTTISVTAKLGKKSAKKTMKVTVAKAEKQSQLAKVATPKPETPKPEVAKAEAPSSQSAVDLVEGEDGLASAPSGEAEVAVATEGVHEDGATAEADVAETAGAPAEGTAAEETATDASGADGQAIAEIGSESESAETAPNLAEIAAEPITAAVDAVVGSPGSGFELSLGAESALPTTTSGATKTTVKKHGVVVENGNTYYYDNSGSKVYGWITENGVTRYCNPTTGVMAKGGEVWAIGGSKGYTTSGYRYFESNGALFKGWKTINGKAKYFRPSDGMRCQGEVFIPKGECGSAAGGVRYFDSNGSIVLGWHRFSNGDKYYEPTHGVRSSGVTQVFHPGGSNWYYFRQSDGVRVADYAESDYYFRSGDGVGLRYDSAEYARLVFNEYNKFRLTRNNAASGRYAVLWSGDSNYGSSCGDAFEAKLSGLKCAQAGKLVHTAYQRRSDLWSRGVEMCDILMESPRTLTPAEAIDAWYNSPGHRKMMQCDTAHHAGFAAVKFGTRYYLTIVYEFNGYNQSGW